MGARVLDHRRRVLPLRLGGSFANDGSDNDQRGKMLHHFFSTFGNTCTRSGVEGSATRTLGRVVAIGSRL